jgi:ankyrin repeat protein
MGARTAGRQSLLHFAALGGCVEVVRRLLAAGAAPGDADACGNTPLHCAAERGRLQVGGGRGGGGEGQQGGEGGGRKGEGAGGRAQGGQPWRVLRGGQAWGDGQRGIEGGARESMAREARPHPPAPQVVELLVGAGVAPGVANAAGVAPLHCAAKRGSAPAVQLLLRLGAAPAAACGAGRTALHCAAELGHLEVVRLLLLERGQEGGSRAAAEGGAAEAAAAGCAGGGAGCDVNLPDGRGWAPLHHAAEQGHAAMAEALLAAGADVRSATRERWSPLHLAAREGHEALAAALLAAGADVAAEGARRSCARAQL